MSTLMSHKFYEIGLAKHELMEVDDARNSVLSLLYSSKEFRNSAVRLRVWIMSDSQLETTARSRGLSGRSSM